MNTVLVFLLIVIFVVVALILIEKSGKFNKPSPYNSTQAQQQKTFEQRQQAVPSNTYLTIPTWSQPQPYQPNTTGQCLAYTFLGGPYYPAQPSYSELNNPDRRGIIQSSNYAGASGPLYGCIDVDQLYASTIVHECLYPNSQAGAGCILTVPTVDPNNSGNILPPGYFAPQGTIEGVPSGAGASELYTSCVPNTSTGTTYCQGSIGLIIPNFKVQTSNVPQNEASGNQCLAASTTDPNLVTNGYYQTLIQPCNLVEQGQIFRVTTYSLDSSYNLNQDANGNLAQIVHRPTGFYLAPNLELISTPGFDTNGNSTLTTTFSFDNLNINIGTVTDNSGNTFSTSSKLLLVNPIYDLTRNGVYWLLQNQTINPTINPVTTNLKSYINVGSYPNQTNYYNFFKNGPGQESYFFTQSVSDPNAIIYPISNPIVPPKTIPDGQFNPNYECGFNNSLDEPTKGSTSGCYFNITLTYNGRNDITATGSTVSNVNVGISPQQFVYVPDLYLLPTITTDPNRLWSYLINSYSINIDNNNNPLLTPYRQSVPHDLTYTLIPDTSDPDCIGGQSQSGSNPSDGYLCKNWFLELTGAVPTPSVHSDNQFINYSQYVQQIQTPIIPNTGGGNQAYQQKGNPLVPTAASGTSAP